MEYNDLLKILDGDISHIANVNEVDVAFYDVRVIIFPKNVKKILISYLEGKFNEADLTDWAGFLCIRCEYVSPENKNPDYYEDMWYVIQRLSTPELDGKIDKALVNAYLKELEKYSD